MKKTFRRRAPRKGTLRKRTYGGRKLRKMRGGFRYTDNENGTYNITFTEEEKQKIRAQKAAPSHSIVGIYNDVFMSKHAKNEQLKQSIIEQIETTN